MMCVGIDGRALLISLRLARFAGAFRDFRATDRDRPRMANDAGGGARGDEALARGRTVTLGGLLVPATIDVDALLAFAARGEPLADPAEAGGLLKIEGSTDVLWTSLRGSS